MRNFYEFVKGAWRWFPAPATRTSIRWHHSALVSNSQRAYTTLCNPLESHDEPVEPWSLLASQDWEFGMSSAGATPTSSDPHSYRDSHKSLKRPVVQLRIPLVSLRCSAILVFLSFLTFVVMSSPHHVHHLGDAAPTDQPAPHPHERQSSQLPACVVLFVLHSAPILEAEQVYLSAPVESRPLESSTPWCCPPDVDTHSTPIRAPPFVSCRAEHAQHSHF